MKKKKREWGRSKSIKLLVLSFRDKWKLGKSSEHELCSFNETPLCCDLFFSHKMKSPSAALRAQADVCACFFLRLTIHPSSWHSTQGAGWPKEKCPWNTAWDSPAVPRALVLFLLLSCLQNIMNHHLKTSCSCKIVTVVCPLKSDNMRIGKTLQSNYRNIVAEVNTKFWPWDGKYP